MDDYLKIRRQAVGLLSLLGVQYVLGMILNLYVKLPNVHPGVSGGYFSRSVHSFGWAITNGGGLVLILHIIVAIGLLLGSVGLLIRAVAGRAGPWVTFSALGLLGVIVALTNGLAFLGYANNVSSLVMAIGFIFSLTMYSVGLSVSPKRNQAVTRPEKTSTHSPRSHHGFGRFRASHS